ncbi:MAG: deoxyguanosinetriphosphate triphosphohydrolase [Geminicoccales bacterium]
MALSNQRTEIAQLETPALLACACRPKASRGRRVAEDEGALRSAFQRDRDRILHSAAFRRLQYKTQVFVNHEGDHFRTRLTHSLEVAQIGRTAARYLGLNEDLAETVALAHDLGHSPFGHAGERALNDALKDYGGFDHNAQALRVVTVLESRYASFDGLNLTWDTLEGVVKHNGPLVDRVEPYIAQYSSEHDLELATQPSAEAQIAALADDIAYTNHDLDDGLRAGLFTPFDLRDLPLIGEIFHDVDQRYPGIDLSRLIHESVRRLIHLMVSDLISETERRLATAKPQSVDDIRGLDHPVVAFSEAVAEPLQVIRRFLRANMYNHYKVMRMTRKARFVVTELFEELFDNPDCLSPEWQSLATTGGEFGRAEVIRDYIAGMTDRYALDEHDRLFKFTKRDT